MGIAGLLIGVTTGLLGAEPLPSDVLYPEEGVPIRAIIETVTPDGRVIPAGASEQAYDLAGLERIEFRAVGAEAPEPAPHRIALRGGMVLSGRFAGMDDGVVYLAEVDGATVAIDPAAVASIQRTRPPRVLLDEDFEGNLARWSQARGTRLSRERSASGRQALAIPAGRPGETDHRLAELAYAGQVTLRFFDDREVVKGARLYVELEFATPGIAHKLRVDLGWESPAYRITADPLVGMEVRDVSRRPGWRRLTVDFDAHDVLVAIEGETLAKGPAMGGPLSSLRLGTDWVNRPRRVRRRGGVEAVGYVDDVRIVRRMDVFSHRQEAPGLDEVILRDGDQLMGRLESMTPQAVRLVGPYGSVRVAWERIGGVLFGRQHVRPRVAKGWFVHLLRANGDRLDGVLRGVDGRWVRLRTTFAGELKLRRSGVRQIVPVFRGTRWQIDNDYHHLGDSLEEQLDVPEPEGHRYERTFTLPEAPGGPAMVALTVVEMVGSGPGAAWKDELEQGRLCTNLLVNGRHVATLNESVSRQSAVPLRIRVPVPPGVLRAGENRVVIEGVPAGDEATGYDDFGFWGLAIDLPAAAS